MLFLHLNKQLTMRRLFALLLITIAPALLMAQPIDGTWHGKLRTGQVELDLVFRFGQPATIDSPNQGAKGIPMDVEEQTDSRIKVRVASIGAAYEGELKGDVLVGTFRQMGASFSLVLERGELINDRPQTPQHPLGYKTVAVEFSNDGATLSGTLTLPENPQSTTVVLMVTGSGQQNRDEELFDHRPFAVISHALAKAGIASLRYDDRGFGASTGNFAEATTQTFAADAASGLQHLCKLGYRRVGILGHSEGGTIAFMLADKVDFVVALAPMAERGDSTLYNQALVQATTSGLPFGMAQSYASEVLSGAQANSQPWMQYFLSLDPAEYIQRAKCPALVVFGNSDKQVLAERNAPLVQKCMPHATVKRYDGLNHLFQHCTTGLPNEYGQIQETIATELLTDIIAWIRGL